MKKLLIAATLLAASFSASATPLSLSRISVRERIPQITVVWIPLGTGAICAALPGSLPSCGIGPGLVGWMEVVTINGITTTYCYPANAHAIN